MLVKFGFIILGIIFSVSNADKPKDKPKTNIQSSSTIENNTSLKSKGYPLCITFELFDTFGDGWDSAKLQIVDQNGRDTSHFPTSATNPLTGVSYCFDTAVAKNGETVTAGVTGLQSKHEWEIFWTATTDDNEGTMYMGTFDTFMTFQLTVSKGIRSIVMKSSKNLLESRKGCTSCTAVDDIYAKPLKSSGSSPKSGPATSKTSGSNPKSGVGAGSKKRQLAPIKSKGSYSLYSTGTSEGWHSLYGYGTTYDISSLDGYSRYYSGGWCSDDDLKVSKSKDTSKSPSSGKFCDLSNLPAGEYSWRVSGAMDDKKDEIAWNFCGIDGGVSTEVLFEIDNSGQCSPLKTHIYTGGSVDESKMSISNRVDSGQATWTLHGNIEFNGFRNTEQAKEQAFLLPTLITDVLNKVSMNSDTEDISAARDVSIVSWDAPGSIFDLSTKIKFTFEATLIPERYGYDSTTAGIQSMYELAENIQTYIQTSIDMGIFLEELQTRDKTLLKENSDESSTSSDTIENKDVTTGTEGSSQSQQGSNSASTNDDTSGVKTSSFQISKSARKNTDVVGLDSIIYGLIVGLSVSGITMTIIMLGYVGSRNERMIKFMNSLRTRHSDHGENDCDTESTRSGILHAPIVRSGEMNVKENPSYFVKDMDGSSGEGFGFHSRAAIASMSNDSDRTFVRPLVLPPLRNMVEVTTVPHPVQKHGHVTTPSRSQSVKKESYKSVAPDKVSSRNLHDTIEPVRHDCASLDSYGEECPETCNGVPNKHLSDKIRLDKNNMMSKYEKFGITPSKEVKSIMNKLESAIREEDKNRPFSIQMQM